MEPGLQVFPVNPCHTCSVSLAGNTIDKGRDLQPVDKQIKLLWIITGFRPAHNILYADRHICKETGITFFLEFQHQFYLVPAVFPVEVGKDIDGRRFRRKDEFKYVINTVAFDLYSGYRRIGPAYTGKYKPQIIEYFRSRSYSRARISRIDFLLYRNGRRDSLDKFDIRFGHSAKKLPCI